MLQDGGKAPARLLARALRLRAAAMPAPSQDRPEDAAHRRSTAQTRVHRAATEPVKTHPHAARAGKHADKWETLTPAHRGAVRNTGTAYGVRIETVDLLGHDGSCKLDS